MMLHEPPVTIVDVEVHPDGGAVLELSDARRVPVRALHAWRVTGGASPRVSVDDGFASFDAAPFAVSRVVDACNGAGLVVVKSDRVVGGDLVTTCYVTRPASPEWLAREPASPARTLVEQLLAALPSSSLSLFTPGAWRASVMRVAVPGIELQDDALVISVEVTDLGSRVSVSFAGAVRFATFLDAAAIAAVVAFAADVVAERVVVARGGAVCAWCAIDNAGHLGDVVEVSDAVFAVAEVRSLRGRFDRRLRADELERLSSRETREQAKKQRAFA